MLPAMARETPATEPAALRDAATVVLLRDRGGNEPGPEVLLLRRRSGSGFAAGAWVFPGGTVDDGDRRLAGHRWHGLDVDGAAGRLQLSAERALGAHVAGVRETFEEAGILLACDGTGNLADPRHPACRRLRAALTERPGRGALEELLAEAGLTLDLGELVAFARWMTPRSEPRRFDTVFLAARAPAAQVVRCDADEAVAHRWLTPAEALAEHHRGGLAMIHPTIKTLEWLAGFADVDMALRAAAASAVEPVLPHIEHRDGQPRVLHPHDEGYPAELRAEMEARR